MANRTTQNQLHTVIDGLKSAAAGEISGREIILNGIADRERKAYRLAILNPNSPTASEFGEGTSFRGSVNQKPGVADRSADAAISVAIVNPKIREFLIQMVIQKSTNMESWSPKQIAKYTQSAESFSSRVTRTHIKDMGDDLDRTVFDVLFAATPTGNITYDYDVSALEGLAIKQDIFVAVNALLNGDFTSNEITYFTEDDLMILMDAITFDKVWDTALEAGAGSDKQYDAFENGMNPNGQLKMVRVMRTPATILNGTVDTGIVWGVITIGEFGTLWGIDGNELFMTPTPRKGDFMDIYDWYDAGYTSVFPEFSYWAVSGAEPVVNTQEVKDLRAFNTANLFVGKSLTQHPVIKPLLKNVTKTIAAMNETRKGKSGQVLKLFSKEVQDAVTLAMGQTNESLETSTKDNKEETPK